MRVDVALREARSVGLDRADAEILLAACTKRSRAQLFAYPEFELDAHTLDQYQQQVRKRSIGIPVAYLLGVQEFYGLCLGVGPEVLVPRPETELLVEFALSRAAADAPYRVLDLGTGSGAIALAIAATRPQWAVHATDRSPTALARAQHNAKALGLTQLHWSLGDWFAAVNGERFDLILSNPPYLAADDAHLPSLRHEPIEALVAGVDALGDLRLLIEHAPAHLHSGGWLALEHGCEQAAAVRELLEQAGYTAVGTQSDLAGLERISFGCWDASQQKTAIAG